LLENSPSLQQWLWSRNSFLSSRYCGQRQKQHEADTHLYPQPKGITSTHSSIRHGYHFTLHISTLFYIILFGTDHSYWCCSFMSGLNLIYVINFTCILNIIKKTTNVTDSLNCYTNDFMRCQALKRSSKQNTAHGK